MDKEINFNPADGALWVTINMEGLYSVTYTYQLWSANPNEPPILTNPLRAGSNEIPHLDAFQVINDFNVDEPIASFNDRIIDVRFWVKKKVDDDGYNLIVTVLQGNTLNGATGLGDVVISGQVGSQSLKEEFVLIRLI
ncbi:hypothetical protein [Spirosoma jeollabukense]